MTPQQKIQLIIILIVAGSGVIRWMYQRLQEQAAKKRAMDAVEQRRLEALRTGRNLDAIQEQPPVIERQQVETQVASQRRAQIEEFRRRQQERATQRTQATDASKPRSTAPGPAQGPMIRIPGSSGPTVPMPARVQLPRKPAPPQATPKRAAQRAQDAPRPLRAQPVESPKRQEPPKQPPQPVPAPVTRFDPTLIRPQTPEEWRRAIIVNAVLMPAPGLAIDPTESRPSF